MEGWNIIFKTTVRIAGVLSHLMNEYKWETLPFLQTSLVLWYSIYITEQFPEISCFLFCISFSGQLMNWIPASVTLVLSLAFSVQVSLSYMCTRRVTVLNTYTKFFVVAGIKCPVCAKFVLPDDIECHLVMCLTKPRLSYNGIVFHFCFQLQ